MKDVISSVIDSIKYKISRRRCYKHNRTSTITITVKGDKLEVDVSACCKEFTDLIEAKI